MRKNLIVLVLMTSVFWGCQEEALNLRIRYDHVKGLKKDDRVIFEQHQIGTVKHVTYSEQGDFMVDIAIAKNFSHAATEHSQFYIIEDPKAKETMAVEVTQKMAGGEPLQNNSIVEGSTRASAIFNNLLDGFAHAFGRLQADIYELLNNLGGIPDSEEFKKLEAELKRLKQQMADSEDELKRTIREKLLPRLQEEMKALKERLRKLGREDELKSLEIEMEEIKKL